MEAKANYSMPPLFVYKFIITGIYQVIIQHNAQLHTFQFILSKAVIQHYLGKVALLNQDFF
jgi:hypothetical protein